MHWLWNFIGVSTGDWSLESVIGENGEGNIISSSGFASINIDTCQGSVDASKSQLELSLEEALVFELKSVLKYHC